MTPKQGKGVGWEEDYGNAGGSILMLAMLCPEVLRMPAAPTLAIFGTEAHDGAHSHPGRESKIKLRSGQSAHKHH